MHHTIGWFESIAQDAEADVQPIVDGIWTIQNNHFLPQDDWFLQVGAFISADSVRARWRTPTFRQITTPFVRPVIGDLSPGDDPNIADYRLNALRFRRLEEIEFLAEQTAVGAANVYGMACVSRAGMTPMPSGDVYTLRATSVGVAVANVWTQIAMSFQDTLPQGVFVVVGGWIQSATSVMFRLIFEDQIDRPGALGSSSLENSAAAAFRFGGLGVWGRFNSNRMPNVEVVCNAADAAHELYIDIMRIG